MRRLLAAGPAAVEPRFILGAALRRTGDLAAALDTFVPLAAKLPTAWGVHYELGMTLAGLGRTDAAVSRLQQAVALNPASSLVLHALGDALSILGREAAAIEIQSRAVPGSVGDLRLVAAAAALLDHGDTAPLAALGMHISDIAVVRLIADAGLRSGRAEAVAALLTTALATTPAYLPARFGLALALYRLERSDAARAAIDVAIGAALKARPFRALRAAIQMQRGDVAAAIEDYAAATDDDTEADAATWHGYGHALRAAGQQDAAVAAYRRALALAPGFAEVYWSLANLKTWRFSPAERAAMAALLPNADSADRAWLNFALGKADDDAGSAASSFTYYAAGNAARRTTAAYDREAHDDFIARSIATFTPAFFAERAGSGDTARDPIFIIGMPRSGSTLVEQIVASHPMVEGLSELPDLTAVARGLAGRYPEVLIDLLAAAFTAAGREYLDRTQPRRRSGRPHFVDKFPGNFLHTGLIHLTLPQATIVDVRRDPVATCFSLFKQLFARGQAYSYDLGDLGHYYTAYRTLMDHFAAVLPGRVMTLSYESLIDDAEAETRRLLAHADLPFDPACLRFFASGRAVRTPSSEQVRQPIYRAGLDDWRRFEPWLDPLIEALGPLARPGGVA